VYFAQEGIPNDTFNMTSTSYNYIPTYPVRYFHFELGTHDREYWVEPNELISTIRVFNDTFNGYTINFLDFCGALKDSPYVTASFYINGTLMAMEKRKVDQQSSVSMSLVNTRKYVITLSGSGTTYTWGDLLMTDQTVVQLTLRAVDFPKELVLQYKYLQIYAQRDYATETVTISYHDTKANTDSATIILLYANGTEAYSQTLTGASTFEVNYLGNNTFAYQVEVVAQHGDYGPITNTFYLVEQSGVDSPPFGLAWFGSTWVFESAYLLPAFLILCAAICFSTLNAHIGGVLTVLTAIILSAIGWIPIGGGAIVVAFSLAILMALSYQKRRVSIY
jgi:hypothetical protein